MDREIKDKYSQFLERIEKIDTDMMMLIAKSEEVAIFNADPIVDLINYQWGVTGFNFHLVGFVNFVLYMIMLTVYIVQVYINDRLYEFQKMDTRIKVREGPNNVALVLIFGMIYPSIYLLIQIYKAGVKMFTKPFENVFIYLDLLFIIACLLTVIWQLESDPQDFVPKVILII